MKFLPLWKKDPDLVWLGEVSFVVLQQTLRDQDRAFTNFFDSCTGKRNGPRMRYPRFKTRNSRKSLRYTKVGFTYANGEIRLAKMMDEPLNIVWSRPLPAGVAPSSVTVSLDAAGRWFISILCEDIITPLATTNKTVGVDVGLKTFAVYSDGQHIEHPKLLAAKAARLARYQRVASRRKPKPGKEASRNYVKAKTRVAKQHVKVADARRDFLHKITTDLVTRFDVVVFEDLHIAGMKRDRHLAKSISDSGWGEFRTLIEYKTQWYGKRIVVINRWHPSSRLCSTPGCDWKNNHLKLSATVLDLFGMRHPTRLGSQRREEHTCRRTGGSPTRVGQSLWRGHKTESVTACDPQQWAADFRESGNNPERSRSRASVSRVSGWGNPRS